MEEGNKLIKYITENYKRIKNECDNIDGEENVKRYTKPIMSQYVENGIALFINDIIKDKKMNYYIDSQLCVGERQPIRPDIIIYDEKDEIHAIVEVKSQLGYSGNFKKSTYKNRIKKIKEAARKGILKIKKGENGPLYFKVSEDCKDFIVILMSENGRNNFSKFEGTNYFVLFNSTKEKKVWYDKLSFDCINKDVHGFDELVEFIKKTGN